MVSNPCPPAAIRIRSQMRQFGRGKDVTISKEEFLEFVKCTPRLYLVGKQTDLRLKTWLRKHLELRKLWGKEIDDIQPLFWRQKKTDDKKRLKVKAEWLVDDEDLDLVDDQEKRKPVPKASESMPLLSKDSPGYNLESGLVRNSKPPIQAIAQYDTPFFPEVLAKWPCLTNSSIEEVLLDVAERYNALTERVGSFTSHFRSGTDGSSRIQDL